MSSTTIYAYDEAGRLREVRENGTVVAAYFYDQNGNRLSATSELGITLTGEYDAQDRLTRYGNTTYGYTANGELESKTNGTETTLYQYDVMGNLTSVTLPDTTQVEYLIDGQNRRVGKKINGPPGPGILVQRLG